MIRRVQTELRRKLASFPVVGLLGARQVGKTTLAQTVAREHSASSVYLDLERPSDLARLTDAELFLTAHAQDLVILDEVHRRPDLFSVLRALVDSDRRPGRFLILGSASPDLLRQSAESLAGRIAYVELGPLTLDEVGPTPEMQERLWLRGGFPLSFLAPSDAASLEWRQAFIKPFSNATCRSLACASWHLPCADFGKCWRITTANCGTVRNWLAHLVFLDRPCAIIWIFWKARWSRARCSRCTPI